MNFGRSHASCKRLLLLPCLVVAALLTTAGDWPSYLHDGARTASSGDETILSPANAGRLTPLWTYTTGGVIAASPTVVGGVAYVGSWDGYEYALDATNGTLRWKTYLGTTSSPNCDPSHLGITSGATVQNGVVYVGGGDAYWYALDATTGAVLWKVFTGDNSAGGGHYNWSSPLLYNGYAYIGVASLGDCPLVQGQLLQVSLSTHQVVHTFNAVPAGQVGGGIWTSPSVDAATNTIYVTTGTTGAADETTQPQTQAMVALDAATLAVKGVWQIPPAQLVADSDWGTTPTVFDDASGTHLVAAADKNGYLYTFDRTDVAAGPLWQQKIGNGGSCPQCGDGMISSGTYAGGQLYFASGTTTISGTTYAGSVVALDPATGSSLWTHRTSGAVLPALAAADGLIIDGEGPTLEVLNAASGAPLYSYTTGGTLYGAPSVANGMIFEGSTNDTVYAFGVPGATPPTNTPASTTTATSTPSSPTATSTPAVGTATATNTPSPTNMPGTATPTATPTSPASTATATNTTAPATSTPTPTNTRAAATPTNTPSPPTATNTNTPAPATSTPTNTPRPATATPTGTAGPATATPTPVATTTLFATGFEAGDPQPTWADTVDQAAGGLLNVGGICCGLSGPQAGVRTGETAHAGSAALMYSGMDASASASYAYLKSFDLSAQGLTVGPSTTLSYWIYPQSHYNTVPISGANSSCVALDLVFTDGSTLHAAGAVDQAGNPLSPSGQCGHLALDTWDRVTSVIGAVAAGKAIARLNVGYDQAPNTGGYRGYIDDVSLTTAQGVFNSTATATPSSSAATATTTPSATSTPSAMASPTSTPSATAQAATSTPTTTAQPATATTTPRPATATPTGTAGPATATPTPMATTTLFATGFEAGDPQPTWADTVDQAAGGLLNVGGICCGLSGPQAGVRTGETAHAGSAALMYSGMDASASASYAYLKLFDLSAQGLTVGPSTTLSYWIYPQSHYNTVPISGANSSCVALDLVFTDGSTLHAAGAVDQAGNPLSPSGQCGHLALDTWDRVTSAIGAVAAGKAIARLNVGYDQAPNTGGFRGYIDDVSLTTAGTGPTNTPGASTPTATATPTVVPPTATNTPTTTAQPATTTPSATSTPSATAQAATPTPTTTAQPATATNTPRPATATPTGTAGPATATPTPVATTTLFATGFEAGDPQPTWADTVDQAAGGLLNVGGICCGLSGPQAGVRTGETAHAGSAALMYSGMDASASAS